MRFLSGLLSVIAEWFKSKNREAREHDRDEIRANEKAKKEVNKRNEVEELTAKIAATKDAQERQALLDELRKHIAQ